jgi:predicted MPP superfamily phosphohydrolase
MAAAYAQPLPDVQQALAGVPPTDPVILLSHRPTGAALNAQAGAGLQLSGHTHGGQILGPHLLTQWANEGYVSGLYQVGGMTLYVSNGTGLWPGFPIRLGRPSEITQIVLRSPAKATPQ